MSGYKFAFSLSADEVRDATPPGTVKLIDHHLSRTVSGRNVDNDVLRLVPLPSSDPADPLNWPMWRKIAVLLCVSLYSFVSNFSSSSMASALPVYATPLAFMPPIPFARLTQLIAVNALMQGASNLWWVPMANSYGRRPIILAGIAVLCACSAWAGVAKSFNSLLVARLFMGIGGGPADAVAPDILGEIFFVHQTGRGIAIYTLFLASGSLVGGLAGGYLVEAGGLPWLHWTNIIMAGATFVLCAFLLPETLFDRENAVYNSDVVLADDYGKASVGASQSEFAAEEAVPTSSLKPFTMARSLKIGTHRKGILKRLLDVWLVLRLPGVWLVMFWYAGLVGGIVTISTVAPQIVASPPYLWGANVGLANAGAVIGAFIGGLYTYLSVDRALKAQAKKEIHGYSEAEARLTSAVPGLVLATLGLWTFGFCAQYPSKHAWIGLEFGFGMVAFGLMQVPSVGFSYIIEAYNSVSGDCFVAITFLRAVVGFAWTFFVGEWVAARGVAEPFGIFGMLMGIFTLLTIPVVIWGKRTRIATAKWLPSHADH